MLSHIYFTTATTLGHSIVQMKNICSSTLPHQKYCIHLVPQSSLKSVFTSVITQKQLLNWILSIVWNVERWLEINVIMNIAFSSSKGSFDSDFILWRNVTTTYATKTSVSAASTSNFSLCLVEFSHFIQR